MAQQMHNNIVVMQVYSISFLSPQIRNMMETNQLGTIALDHVSINIIGTFPFGYNAGVTELV